MSQPALLVRDAVQWQAGGSHLPLRGQSHEYDYTLITYCLYRDIKVAVLFALLMFSDLPTPFKSYKLCLLAP